MINPQETYQNKQDFLSFYKESKHKIFTKQIRPGRFPCLLNNHKKYEFNQSEKLCSQNPESPYKIPPAKLDIQKLLPSSYNCQEKDFDTCFVPSDSSQYPQTCIGLVAFEVCRIWRYCTGTLIYGNLVLTSDICFSSQTNHTSIWFITFNGQKIKVRNKYKTEKKQQEEVGNLSPGIALLELEEGVSEVYGYSGIYFGYFEDIMQNSNPLPNPVSLTVKGYKFTRHQNSKSLPSLFSLPLKLESNEPANISSLMEGSLIELKTDDQMSYIVGINIGGKCVGMDVKLRSQLNRWVQRKQGVIEISQANKGEGTKDIIKAISYLNLPYLKGVSLASIPSSKIFNSSIPDSSKNSLSSLCWLQIIKTQATLCSIKYLSKLNLPLLNRLSLSQSSITSKHIELLTKLSFPYLSVLSLSSNSITNEGLTCFCETQWPQLKVLSLCNLVGQCGTMQLSKNCNNFSELDWLQLYGNQVKEYLAVSIVKKGFEKLFIYV